MIRTIIQSGLGNQLFQYAMGWSLAKSLGQELELDISFFDDYNRRRLGDRRIFNLDKMALDSCRIINRPSLNRLYSLKAKGFLPRYNIMGGRIVQLIVEDENDCRNYRPELLQNIGSHGAAVMGCWQNTRYFAQYHGDIVRQFQPNYSFCRETSDILDSVIDTESVGVHIRRGDFVALGYNEDISYFAGCIEKMRDVLTSPHFFIVSDDVEWTKANFEPLDDVTVVDVKSSTKDLDEFFLLSNCRHQIISESTFGWWAAYLNQNPEKIVLVPDKAKGEIFQIFRN